MRNGFYTIQEQYKGDMPGFLEALDNIEVELPICIDSSGDPAVASVGSFLQGFCGELAKYFCRECDLPIGILYDQDNEGLHPRFQCIHGSLHDILSGRPWYYRRPGPV